MEEVHPTRTELLQRKNQIKLASQGCDLLKEKRDALLMEFMEVMDEVLESSARLQKAAANAAYSLATAKAVDGTVSVKSAGMATKGKIEVELKGTVIMGVPIPEVAKTNVKRSETQRGYGLTSVSSRINETAERFEEEINIIIEIAAIETKLKRLGEEIQRTRRRVNALDYVVLPQLKDQVKYIQMALDERAREELFRLKKVKKSIEAKKAAKQIKAAIETGQTQAV